MTRMKLGVNQKQASPYPTAAAAKTRAARKPINLDEPARVSSSVRQQIATASAATQFISVTAASSSAAASAHQRLRVKYQTNTNRVTGPRQASVAATIR